MPTLPAECSKVEYCLLWINHGSMCMPSVEWASWIQALGTIAAIVFAVWLPLWLDSRKRRKELVGHLNTIATDVRIADRQAKVFLESKIKVPAYRLPLYGAQSALPFLLAENHLNAAQATALVQWYIDAKSFNDSLDIAQQLKNEGKGLEIEYGRTIAKANHLVSEGKLSRFENAMTVLRQLGVHAETLTRLPAKVQLDQEEA